MDLWCLVSSYILFYPTLVINIGSTSSPSIWASSWYYSSLHYIQFNRIFSFWFFLIGWYNSHTSIGFTLIYFYMSGFTPGICWGVQWNFIIFDWQHLYLCYIWVACLCLYYKNYHIFFFLVYYLFIIFVRVIHRLLVICSISELQFLPNKSFLFVIYLLYFIEL